MAESRSDYDEEKDNRPPKRSGPARRRDEYDDDEEDRPRRQRSKRALSGVIPYRNGMALAAYYCGFGSLIAILGTFLLVKVMGDGGPGKSQWLFILGLGLGGVLAPLAVIFGILGLKYASDNPEAKGTGHALTGLVMGGLEIVGLIAIVLVRIMGSRP
jgi:hypothetical protein